MIRMLKRMICKIGHKPNENRLGAWCGRCKELRCSHCKKFFIGRMSEYVRIWPGKGGKSAVICDHCYPWRCCDHQWNVYSFTFNDQVQRCTKCDLFFVQDAKGKQGIGFTVSQAITDAVRKP